jgi:penicillin-binding protein 1A
MSDLPPDPDAESPEPAVPTAEPSAAPTDTPPAAVEETRNRREGRNRWTWFGMAAVAAMLLGVVAGIGLAAAIHMPQVDTVDEFTPGLITELRDRDGKVFATYARERRVMLREGEVPDVLRDAIMAAEDSAFLEHGGIDALGVFRAALRNLGEGSIVQGASTITMQLARHIYLTRARTWQRKIEEAFLAVELEKTFSKQQILTLYCNLVFLGHGNYGMESASRYFFGKPATELEIDEAAMLAGIVQAPSRLSPYKRPEEVTRRRDWVIGRMLEEGYITREEHDAAVATPLAPVRHRDSELFAPYFAEEIRQHLERQYGAEALLENGLRVSTTLDPTIQAAAEQALRWGLERLDRRHGWRGPLQRIPLDEFDAAELSSWRRGGLVAGRWREGLVTESDGERALVKIAEETWELGSRGVEWTGRERPDRLLEPGDVAWFRLEMPEPEGDGEQRPEPFLMLTQEPELEGALLVLESATGAVRAMVGGWDYERSKFNRAVQAKRQVGSAFKPFVYGAALETGFTPADTLFDGPAVFPGADDEMNEVMNYSPRNYYRRYEGIITIRRALELSINVTSVKLLDLVGARRVVDFAQRCGIRSDLPPYPSLALGSADITPIELATAYSAIANQGVSVTPYMIEAVDHPDGRRLEEHLPEAHRAMEPEVAHVLTHMLAGVVDRGTAAARAAKLDIDLAGKTGTTDAYTDAWFPGYSPRYSIVVWVGYDEKRPIGRNATGAAAALPIWVRMIEDGLEQGWLQPGEQFVAPPGVVHREVEYLTGLLPAAGADRLIDEALIEGTEPIREYDVAWSRILTLPWYQQRSFYIPKEGERMPEDITDWTLVKDAWETKEEAQEEREKLRTEAETAP